MYLTSFSRGYISYASESFFLLTLILKRIFCNAIYIIMPLHFRRRSNHALAHFASYRYGASSIPGVGRGRMCEKFPQLLAVVRWFPPGTPVSPTRKLISSSSFPCLGMTLAVAEALNPNKPNLQYCSSLCTI